MKKQIFITLALLLLSASLSFAREINPIRDTVLFLGYDKSVSTDLSTVSASSIGVQALQIARGRQALASIAGMLPGVNVTSGGNLPDNGQAMFVRGRGSFSGNNVMYIVDGVERSPAFIGAEEVENITVLKDAAAIAIYGNRGADGVIVITTKKGSAERTSIRYSANFSVRQRPNYDLFDFMNSQERIQFSKEAYDAGVRYQGDPLPQIYTYEGLMAMFNKHMISEADFMKQMERLETVNTDWLDLLTRNSFSHSHNLSVSGGTQRVTYNASFGYSNSEGTEIGNSQNQFTTRLNVGVQFSKRIRASFNISGSSRNSYGYSGVSPQSYALNTSRAVPAFEENGERAFYKQYYTYQLNKSLGNTFNVSANIDFQLLPWLNYQLVGSMAHSSNDSESYKGERTSYIETNYRGYGVGEAEPGSALYKAALLPFGGQLTNNNSNMTSLDMQHKLVASKTFNEIHRVNGMFGFEMRSSKTYGKGTNVWGYVPERGESLISPSLPEDIVPIGGTQSIGWGALRGLFEGGWSSINNTSNYVSFFGTAAYSLKNRYVMNMNIRSDASNRFGQDKRKQFDPTYSFGFSWKIAEEKFIKDNVKWLDQLNLRATYGIQGNVVNSISPELIASYGGLLPGYNEYYTSIASLPNPYLKWERTKTWNLGLDMQIFRAVTMSLEYYGRRSNAIIEQDVPEEYGMGTLKLNGGIIVNHGLEWTMNITPIKTKDLVVSVGFNASKNWNKTETDDRTARVDQLTHRDFVAGTACAHDSCCFDLFYKIHLNRPPFIQSHSHHR